MELEWESNPPKNQMTWHEASDYTKTLGEGWRLPTSDELYDAYDSRVSGFDENYYWSSNTYLVYTDSAWLFGQFGLKSDGKKNRYYVRYVRDVK